MDLFGLHGFQNIWSVLFFLEPLVGLWCGVLGSVFSWSGKCCIGQLCYEAFLVKVNSWLETCCSHWALFYCLIFPCLLLDDGCQLFLARSLGPTVSLTSWEMPHPINVERIDKKPHISFSGSRSPRRRSFSRSRSRSLSRDRRRERSLSRERNHKPSRSFSRSRSRSRSNERK